MVGSFLPLLVLFLIYAVIGTLSKAARKNMAGQKTAARTGTAAPDAIPETEPAQEAAAAPRVREIQPTIRVTEHDDSIYRGSLNAVTGEGYDPCHDAQLAPLTRAETVEHIPAVSSGLQLNWTGDEIVRGFVISEILNRKGA